MQTWHYKADSTYSRARPKNKTDTLHYWVQNFHHKRKEKFLSSRPHGGLPVQFYPQVQTWQTNFNILMGKAQKMAQKGSNQRGCAFLVFSGSPEIQHTQVFSLRPKKPQILYFTWSTILSISFCFVWKQDEQLNRVTRIASILQSFIN